MKFCIIGCGSIGQRHIRNLISLGQRDIVGVEIVPERREFVSHEYGIEVVTTLEKALEQSPNAALVCIGNHLHVWTARRCGEAGVHLFIEKPLSHSLDGVEELQSTVTKYNLAVLVGCNFRFDDGLQIVKREIDSRSIGRVLSLRSEFGHYLPDWHPWEDYRKGYSANKSMGGGIILDRIHEFDNALWLLGDVQEVACTADKISDLDIDTEDIAEIILRFKSGAVGNIHLDYLRRTYHCACTIVGSNGTLIWDLKKRTVKRYDARGKIWDSFDQQISPDINQMYIKELKHFISCVKGEEESVSDLRNGRRVLEVALAAKESALSKRFLQL
jgi:predicted dehydrogenase